MKWEIVEATQDFILETKDGMPACFYVGALFLTLVTRDSNKIEGLIYFDRQSNDNILEPDFFTSFTVTEKDRGMFKVWPENNIKPVFPLPIKEL